MAVALVASRFRIVGELATPLAAAVNAMPIIALAPILYNMFSATSAYPRRLVVTIIVFFPIFVNMLRGLTQVDAVKHELMRSYAASPWAILRKVKVPNALPFLFTGLKLAGCARRHRGDRGRVLRGHPERSRQPHHVGQRGDRLRAGVGLRGGRHRPRPGVLPRRGHPRTPRPALAGRPAGEVSIPSINDHRAITEPYKGEYS